MGRLMRWCVPDVIAPNTWDTMALAFERIQLGVWAMNYHINRAIAHNAVTYAHLVHMRDKV